MIKDSFGRIHDYLRISLTDNCNFRCFYCMPNEDYDFTPASRLMQTDEIVRLAKIFVDQGVNKIRLTGGEPLVRKDAGTIISELGKLPVNLTMTTNGSRIHEMLPMMMDAGVRAVNISLDTLQEEKFLLVTRSKLYQLVRKNIDLLLENNIKVKINMVLMKGFNDGEITDFIAWTRYKPLEIRFIEFMPFTGNLWTSNKVYSQKEILDAVGKEYTYFQVDPKPNDTARHYMIPGHLGSFAIIGTMTSPFCSTCNRMRLTADGKLKNCLFSNGETDLLTVLRAGGDVLPVIKACIWQKEKELGGQLGKNFETLNAELLNNRSMITIGG